MRSRSSPSTDFQQSSGSATMSFDATAGIERADRVLKDHLHARAQVAQRRALLLRELDAFELDRAARGLDDAHERLAGR